ncbi:MAG TPA: hypothetical protein VGB77_14760, partial [Abditibacteriaceae bacterium]
MRASLFTVFFALSPVTMAAPVSPTNNAAPLLAPDRQPTALLLFRTVNRVKGIVAAKTPDTSITSFPLLTREANQVSYQTQLEVWTPRTVLEDASGGLQNLAGVTPQEWAFQVTPAPAWPDLPAEPKEEAQEKEPPLVDEEIKADDPQNAVEITVPETAHAQVYFGCGDVVAPEQPRTARIATAVLERWRHFGRLPIDWGGVGTLGVTQNILSAAQLSEAKTVARAAGEYRLITSFVPDLNFNVGTEQQFLPPLQLSLAAAPSDWSKPLHLSWLPVEGARGYRVRAIGRRFKSTDPKAAIVLWSATPLARLQSEVPVMDVESALKKGEILPPTTLNCTIPAGIF